MKIAVLVGKIQYDSQRRTINGILDKALLDRTNVYLFTCERGKNECPSRHERGESKIYTLPDFTQYNGVILNSDTISDAEVEEQIEKKIKEAGIPCVDLNARGQYPMVVEMENRIGMQEILQHLITEHHVKNICYISGAVESDDADTRLQVYHEIMMENNLVPDYENIYYGDYSFESGRKAVRKFLGNGSMLPDAIVAANDEMAIGAILELRAAGYSVPEDVLVTGYDDSSIAEYNYPRLTTVRRGEYEAGQIAYDKVSAAIRGENVEPRTVIQSKAVFAESCGCGCGIQEDGFYVQEKYISRYVEVSQDMEILRGSSIEFTDVEKLDDLLEVLERYIRKIDIDYFYFCLCGSMNQYREELEWFVEGRGHSQEVYSDTIWVPFAYEKGEVNSYGEFHRSLLLPEECAMKRTGAFYTIVPVHFQENCFGYCVAGNYRLTYESGFYQDFILNLDNALENIRKQSIMKAMIRRLMTT